MTAESRSIPLLQRLAPLLVGVFALGLWEALVRLMEVPVFILPAPSVILEALFADLGGMAASMWVTLRITLMAFLLSAVSGIGLAILFTQSRWIERALFPYAVTLQVTPVVAVAPLILIWVGIDQVNLALLILAWIVGFFPVLSNSILGLKSADHNLRDLFRLYGASRLQTLVHLQLPSALPHILAGLKIAGGLTLIGTVVAEFVAGSGGSTGLAWRIIEAGNRLQIPRMFAALLVLAALGISLYGLLSFIERRLLERWHESARPAAR